MLASDILFIYLWGAIIKSHSKTDYLPSSVKRLDPVTFFMKTRFLIQILFIYLLAYIFFPLYNLQKGYYYRRNYQRWTNINQYDLLEMYLFFYCSLSLFDLWSLRRMIQNSEYLFTQVLRITRMTEYYSFSHKTWLLFLLFS